MKLYIRSLVYYKDILPGLVFNYCTTNITICKNEYDLIDLLHKSGHSLLIGSIFCRVNVIDSEGKIGPYPQDDKKEHWRDSSFKVLRSIVKNGIEFEIIGNKEELSFLKKVSPVLYDKISPHIIWKAKKHEHRKNKNNS